MLISAPLAATLIAMFLLYTYKPNPVMDSYAVTSVFLFVGSAWLALTFLNHGSPQQEQLHITHIGGMKRYLFSQIMALLVPVAMCMAIFMLYPIAAQMFDRPVRIGEFLLAVGGHLVAGGLALHWRCFSSRLGCQTAPEPWHCCLLWSSRQSGPNRSRVAAGAARWLRWIFSARIADHGRPSERRGAVP
ncbi:hypothetical protein VQ056_31045 [Paenibacillus sp. JTLBN-2024]